MNILDKFLDAVKVNDDYDDDDFLDDEDDSFDDEKPKKRYFKKLDDDLDDDFDDYPPLKNPKKAPKQEAAAAKTPKTPKPPKRMKTASGKVTPMYTVQKSTGSGEVCVLLPKTYDDSKEIVDALQDNCTVILNLEGIENGVAQYIIDFALGASYSMHGKYQEISPYIFIFTPEGVEITGDAQEKSNTFSRTGF